MLHRLIISFIKFFAPKYGESESERDYHINLEEEAGRLARVGGRPITNQGALTNFRYGDAPLSKSGCEAVAIYNALMLKGRPIPLSEIVRNLEANGLLINRGKWGTDPFGMRRALRSYGLEYDSCERLSEASEKMEIGDMLLVTVWNNGKRPLRGIHGYLIQKTPEGYLIYNKNYEDHPEFAGTLEEAIGEGRYIVGYIIK